MSKIIKANWKAIPIDGKLFLEGMDGLIGIEECTDYNQDDFSQKGDKRTITNLESERIPKKKKKNVIKTQPSKKIEIGDNDFSPSKFGNTSKIEECTVLSHEENYNNLNAWSSFGLHPTILKAIEESGFTEPTPIQALTLPSAILGRRDILGAAETGSGKTLAFGLPIIMGILRLKENTSELLSLIDNNSNSDESDFETDFQGDALGCVKLVNDVDIKETTNLKPLYALILTPTRELAIQIKNHITAIAKYTGIHVAVVVGGMAAVKQERILAKGPEIVVATPGRLWELIQQGNLHLSQIDNIRFLAIDETDRMLEKGHFQELNDLFERINADEKKLKERQNFVFSATLTLIHELPNYLINKIKFKRSKKVGDMTAEQKLKNIVNMLGITDPKVVDLSEGKGTSETLTECRITCNIDEKDYYLFYFLKKHPGRTLVFCNSIGCVKRLAALLTLLNCNPFPLHASMQQRQRLKNLERFRDNENAILIATDVAARGLDIPHIDHVLHYQTPRTSESYVHRSGRTARASHEGITIVLIEPNEIQRYLKFCKTLGKAEDMPIFPVQDNFLNAVKKRINLARELDKLQLQVKKANSENGWLQKAAEDMDMVVDDFSKKYSTKEAQSQKKLLETKRKQLVTLLSTPIFPKGYSGKYPLFSNDVSSITENKNEENAVELVKNVIAKNLIEKKKNVPLFKARKKDKEIKRGIGFKFNKKDIVRSKKKTKRKR